MSRMIYDFKTHSLHNGAQNIVVPKFSLTINTLELFFELKTGKLMAIQGYFPLIKAVVGNIDIPEWTNGEYVLKHIDLAMFEHSAVYDLTQKIPRTRKYFDNAPLKYDEAKGVIQLGRELCKEEFGIKINDNILCGLDKNSDLKCIYIIPTQFIGR